MSNTLETCETDITVPANYTIALFFGRFFVYPTVYPFVCSDTNKPLTVYKSLDRLRETVIDNFNFRY